MSGFETLKGAIDQGVALSPLQPEDVAFYDEQLSDEAALGIVLSDVTTAEQYLSAKNLITSLEQADDLFRAYVKPRVWPGTDVPRANLGMPVVLEAIEKIMPILFLALFPGKEPFVLEPTGKTKPDAARARAKVLNWAIKQAGFREEIRRSLKTVLQYGLVVGHWGWQESTRKRKTYKMKDDGSGVEKIVETVIVNKPTYDCVDLRNVLVDPGCKTQDVRTAKYVIKQVFITANDLDDLRNDESYKNVPTRDELAFILALNNEPSEDSLKASKTNTYRELQAEPEANKTSFDPLQQPLELLEYWSEDRVITVLQRKIVIRNEENEFGRLPFVSCSFVDVLGSLWGFGIAKLLSGEQRFQQGVINSWIDSLALILNPVYQLLKGVGPGTQQIRVSPGKVVTESGELKPLVTPSITTEALNAVGSSEARAQRRVGANGGADMPSQAMRTAQGVQAFAGDIIQKLQYFLEIFVDLVFVPTLEAFVEMCNDRLTPKQINEILTEVGGKAYQGDILEVYNATCDVNVVAGAKLTTKFAAAQLVPLIIQLVSSQPVQDSFTQQGKKFNYNELLTEALELMGWNVDSLIVDMTPEDQQRAMMMNQASAKAMSDTALQKQKHQDDLENIQEKGFVQAGVAAARAVMKQGMETNPERVMAAVAGQTGE